MAGVSGLFGSVVVATAGTVKAEGIGEWSLDIAMSSNEVTEFGEAWKTRVAGLREASGSFGGNGVSAGTAQATLREYMMGGTAVELRLYETPTTYWTVGSALLTGMGRSISVSGKLDSTYNFEANGIVSYT
jgi:hypothetical protein